MSYFPLWSVEEVPADAEVEGARIYRIVRCPVVASAALVDVVHGQVEAAVLEVEVDVGVYDGVVAYLDAGEGGVLHGKLADAGGIVGRVVGGEEAHVAAHLHAQYLGDVEEQVQVGVERQLWQGQHGLV